MLDVGNSYLHLCSLIVELICVVFKPFLGSELPRNHALLISIWFQGFHYIQKLRRHKGLLVL